MGMSDTISPFMVSTCQLVKFSHNQHYPVISMTVNYYGTLLWTKIRSQAQSTTILDPVAWIIEHCTASLYRDPRSLHRNPRSRRLNHRSLYCDPQSSIIVPRSSIVAPRSSMVTWRSPIVTFRRILQSAILLPSLIIALFIDTILNRHRTGITWRSYTLSRHG